jgi:Mn2+/Fe2+ NRAMP family transporter
MDNATRVDEERQLLANAYQRGAGARLAAFAKLSGPGWLQSAITLGGGSLASSLYLGVLAGFSLLWLQPLAMILGIIMLSSIGYITLSTGERPLVAIRDHVNPVLAYGWALAVAAANIVWCLPQFSLANGVLSQNLLPELFGDDGTLSTMGGPNLSMAVVSGTLLVVATVITWSYDRGGWGLRLYETMLKILVGVIVLCFVGVVISLALSENGIQWGSVWAGLIPSPKQFFTPAASFDPLLDAIGSVGTGARDYWSSVIVSKQQDVIISAAATAVGINMTFLFPYSLLRKGWDKSFRGLATFDLCTGMFIPFVLATGCVVIASAAQFHTKVTADFTIDGQVVIPSADFEKPYNSLLADRNENVSGELTLAEKRLAATLVDRKARHLSGALVPLTGKFVADIIFGVGVLAMALSTISLLMLVSGFVFCEVLELPPTGWPFRIGTLFAGVAGMVGPFFWSKAAFYLAVPTSVFGFVLLPFAYITFVFLMNQKSLLGKNMATGGKRIAWNLLMGFSASLATIGSLYMINKKAGLFGFVAVGIFVLMAIAAHFFRPPK